MTCKGEETKLTKDTKLFKSVRVMEELQGNWAIRWHLKMSVDNTLSAARSKTSHSFTYEVMVSALVNPRYL